MLTTILGIIDAISAISPYLADIYNALATLFTSIQSDFNTTGTIPDEILQAGVDLVAWAQANEASVISWATTIWGDLFGPTGALGAGKAKALYVSHAIQGDYLTTPAMGDTVQQLSYVVAMAKDPAQLKRVSMKMMSAPVNAPQLHKNP
jgi:hypothetical protein